MDILISGDSWGCGEWDHKPPKYGVFHLGLEFYLKNIGHRVVNVSKGGSSNIESIERIFHKLSYKKYDYIFWFQTSPIRNLRPYTTFKEDYKSYQDLTDKSNQLLDNDYKKLNDFRVVIHCIGGCSKLNLDLMSKYKNLIPIIPSVTELILKDYVHPNIWLDEWNHLIGEQFDKESIDFLYNDQNSIDRLNLVEKYRKYFWPDGVHPNRRGHKFIFKYLCEKLNL